jgi:ATP-dependent Lhr-like helicase
MKFVAERFGALKRGLTYSGDDLRELALRFRLSPIYDETIREALLLHVDYPTVRSIYRSLQEGSMELLLFRAKENPSPFAFHLLNKHIDVPELIAPETIEKDNVNRLKYSLDNMSVDLLCFDCGKVNHDATVKSLPLKPTCPSCNSGLLAISTWSTDFLAQILKKKLRGESLEERDVTILTKGRRSADLVLSYGRKAIVAQCVYGIGPQTASRVLAKMHDNERDFYKELLEAKLHFITTRQFWDNK